jgi:predicted acetylornithine/succinylornithine family transaminase
MEYINDYNAYFVPTFSRAGSPIVKGKGSYLFDAEGKKYLDFGTGIAVNALGHAHPALVKACVEQVKKVIHTSNLYITPPHIELARLLVEHSFGTRIFLCNSGTEAIEGALKFARKYASQKSSEKYHVLSFFNGFHGRTYGAMTATAQEKFHQGFGPLLPGFHYAAFNDIKGSREVLDQYNYAAIIVEPLQGEGGIHPATPEFLTFLRDYASEHDIVLIFDEIQCGMGRTGTLWNYEQYGVIPDIMALAKPLGGGLPLGAVVCCDRVSSAMSPGSHGSTFGGNPVACAMGCEVLSIIADAAFLQQVTESGALLVEKLNELALRYPLIKEVRGTGLLVGAELACDPKAVVAACRENGLIVISAGSNTVRFMPPLNVSEKEIGLAIKLFEKSILSIPIGG